MNHTTMLRASLLASLSSAALAVTATPATAAPPAFADPPVVAATIPITSPNNAYQATYDEATGLLYVANPAASEIDVIYTAQATPASTGGVYHTQRGDPEVNEVVERIDLSGADPFGLTLDQETHRLFATSTTTDQLVVVQANNGTPANGVEGSGGKAAIVAKTPIPGHVREVRAHRGDPSNLDDNLVYVTLVNDQAVAVVNPKTGRVKRVFDELVDRSTYPNANWIAGLALNDVGPGTDDDVLYTTSMNQDAKRPTDQNGLVNVVDRVTGEWIQSIDAGSHETTSLAYSAKYHKLYAVGQSTVARGDAGTVTTFDVDPATGRLTRANAIKAGKGALGVAVDEGAGRVLVTNFGDPRTVTVLDAASGDVVGAPLTVGNGALNVVVDPGSHTAYVTNQQDASVSAIDVNAAKVSGTFPIASAPRLYQSAYNPRTGLLYVADPASRRVHVIYTAQATRQSTGRRYVVTREGEVTDPAPNTIVARVNVAAAPVYGLAINARTNTLYGTATTTGEGKLVTIDLATDSVRKVVDVPGHIRDVGVDELRDKAYISAYSTDDVVEYDGATDRITRRIPITTGDPLADGPGGLTVDAKHGRIYTANLGGSDAASVGSVSVIDIKSGKSLQVISSGIPRTTTVAYDPVARRVVATSQGARGGTPPPLGGVTTFAVSPRDGTLTKLNSFLSTPGALGTAIDVAGGYTISTDYGLDQGTVTLVRTRDGQKLGTVAVGAKPMFTVVDRVSRTAYVNNQGSATVSVVSPGTLRVTPKPKASTLRLRVRPAVVRAGRSAWVSVRVKVGRSATAKGSVRVEVDRQLVKVARLDDGAALVRIGTSGLRAGRHTVKASYGGSPTVLPSQAQTRLRIVAGGDRRDRT